MARQYAHNIDLMGLFQLIRASVERLATDPTGLGAGDVGRLWVNTTSNRLKMWNGSVAIDLLDRSNHIGTQAVSTVTGAAALASNRITDFTTAPNAPLPLGGQKITGLADGTASSDAVTKSQLDAVAALAGAAAVGIAIKQAVRAVAISNITLSGLQTVDGVALQAGDRVLVTAQTTPATNGIYVAAAGSWTRPTDADASGEIGPGTQVAVTEGALTVAAGGNADSIWRITSDVAVVPGTTAHTWEKLPYSAGEVGIAGAGLTKTGSTYDVIGGDGVTVGADLVSVNPLRVRRKRTGVVPNATGTVTCEDGTTITVTVTGGTVAFAHNLANKAARLEMTYYTSPGAGNTQGQPYLPDYTNSADGNTLTAVLAGAPNANQFFFDIDG